MIQPSLEAVVEIVSRPGKLWVRTPPEPWPPFIRLDGVATSDSIALVMHTLSVCGGLNKPLESAEDVVSDAVLILPGGLRATMGSDSIMPSCCCGLEDWREWLGLLEGETSLWLGHDPAPWVECTAQGFTVWADGGMGGSFPSATRIEFTNEQLAASLSKVKRDLNNFLESLRVWARRNATTSADSLVRVFDRAFQISRPSMAPKTHRFNRPL